ncbi:succinate dehydrogenase cytochrome b subunit [Ameyamaea chiangmaiensis NBRC 103196]|uniref:Succinate dehydrogenase cytochrome b556 subunit n=1 Tax=Ameyamaea chiangmaiensis TaxID=442969 RepID=A0A850PFW6_9PROT|nr:succinate dehydrogenase, cytochrome b556 subunit [Ameyamaea chiangmaiensis]MBS4075056.1 succinate dehydrogenase, cytochrome b556 subunit [Ameyamaea chiangmaiensis]NVN41126.1 succinate dehydrogenase, cytochrome b556 subunit [Ameyamaea chiangmaiensis]GBQ65623.1 succinate dehydrogenase cytochrome b subunit [Ameyamaea chiangmaiensis NBRC 103196]
MQDVREALYVGQRSDGSLIRRPMSPHLQVYRFRLSMFLSIANRAAGVVSAGGAALGVLWLSAAANGPKSFARAQRVTGHPLGRLVLAGWSLAAVYHLIAGIRHLIWDSARRFDKAEINEDGKKTVIATLATTAALVGALFAVASSRKGKVTS